ncbi:cytochrome-c peroxidase [Nonlabens agnitus]|uniref:Methylamine utilization protein n=1 Tax=Nonlabens agnitus TaxID=870484 RepID=A0A2S9WR45_9FLAO|nr:cytochrome c peroxidase [Nonlabens agnitus]PRP65938.1 methylamine utilization protein [Nonlabens agnitus]
MNYQNIKKACFIASLLFLISSCKEEQSYKKQQRSPLEQLQELYLSDLDQAIHSLSVMESMTDTDSMQRAFKTARENFKSVEPILSFQDLNNYTTLNAPNILKVEEEDATDIKIKKASSYQTLEEILFTESPDVTKVHNVVMTLRRRLQLVRSTTDLSHYQPYHVLWIIRKQLVRSALTGVTGFDSPVLESSLDDAVIAFAKAKQILQLYHQQFKKEQLLEKWKHQLDQAQHRLSQSTFENFDRYAFLKQDIDPLLELWVATAQDWEVQFPLELAIKNEATTLFSKETLSLDYFADRKPAPLTDQQITLGKQLFNDTRLSSDGMISCATCHVQDLAFSDGRPIAKGQQRNSPTLTYAAYQRGFFYDKRSGSLEGQIISVINNETEFHSDINNFTAAIEKDDDIVKQFTDAYHKEVGQLAVRTAIADYVRSLNSWDSKWDRNMRDEENTLTQSEINGFNLFMGKAKCATCHFAPVFNGTVPPDFMETELEHLGVPSKNLTVNASIDPDTGRYEFLKTENRKHFFKTPSIRNVAVTAPYMHNGVYQTLEEVVDFYNRGGGSGIGITDQEFQTLPPDPLNLTAMEQKDLVNFMKSLTDQAFTKSKVHSL